MNLWTWEAKITKNVHMGFLSCLQHKYVHWNFKQKEKKHSPLSFTLYTFIYKSYLTFRSVFSSLVSPRVGGGVKLGSFKNKEDQSCLHLKLQTWSCTVELCYLTLGYPKLPAIWNSNYFPLNILFSIGYLELPLSWTCFNLLAGSRSDSQIQL